ncbi:MAG: hypothetical protein AAF587_18875 [Bacteroidota bacterium]
MDKLKVILRTLSPEDHKELKGFVQRQKPKKQRKDLELLALLTEDKAYTSQQIVEKLYPKNNNQTAYHALRKRLIHQLTDFIVLKRRQEDPTTASTVMGMISLAQHLFAKRADKLAWEMARKAEKMARAHEQYDLLNAIFNLQIEHADLEGADALDQILQKRNANKLLADEDERARIANSVITQKLAEVRLKGKDLNFDHTIKEVLEVYHLTEAVSKHPRLLYNLMFIARSAVVANKDFYTFEPYIIDTYQKLAESHGFPPQHHAYQLRFLYMIAHVLYRNKKFEQSVRYLDQMHDALFQHQQSHFERFYPRYVLLLAANYSFLDRLDEAIDLLEQLLNNSSIKLKIQDALDARFNLCIYYYQKEEFQRVIQCNFGFTHSDKWMEKKMGKDWVIRRNISEIIFQYDLDNHDVCRNKIRSLERNYKELLVRPEYVKAVTFLGWVKEIMKHPEKITKPAFYQEVRRSFDFQAMEREDIQEVHFYAWLKAKMVQQPFATVLTQLVHRRDEVAEVGESA